MPDPKPITTPAEVQSFLTEAALEQRAKLNMTGGEVACPAGANAGPEPRRVNGAIGQAPGAESAGSSPAPVTESSAPVNGREPQVSDSRAVSVPGLGVGSSDTVPSALDQSQRPRCPECASDEVTRGHVGPSRLAPETAYWACNDCGHTWGFE